MEGETKLESQIIQHYEPNSELVTKVVVLMQQYKEHLSIKENNESSATSMSVAEINKMLASRLEQSHWLGLTQLELSTVLTGCTDYFEKGYANANNYTTDPKPVNSDLVGMATDTNDPGKLRVKDEQPQYWELNSGLVTKVVDLLKQFREQMVVVEKSIDGVVGGGAEAADATRVHDDGADFLNGEKPLEICWLGLSPGEVSTVLLAFEISFKRGFDVSEKEHPLCNPLILKTIFSNLEVCELQACRLTNLQWWSKTAVLEIRKKCKHVRIHGNLEKFCLDFLNSKLIRNEDEPFPYTKFYLQFKRHKDENYEEFFNKYGTHIMSLKLLSADPSNNNLPPTKTFQYRNTLNSVFQNGQNLRSLTLCKFPDSVSQGSFVLSNEEQTIAKLPQVNSLSLFISPATSQEFLDGLFNILPNLRVLILKSDWSPAQNFEPIIGCFQNLKLTEFRSLSYHGYSEAFWEQLGKQRLTILQLYVDPGTTRNATKLEKFFLTQSETLETLILPGLFDRAKVSIPTLPQLKRLKVYTKTYYEGVRGEEPVEESDEESDEDLNEELDEDFNLLRHHTVPLLSSRQPNLKSVSFISRNLESLIGDCILPTVYELHLKEPWLRSWSLTPGMIRLVGLSFPNLGKLTVRCDPDRRSHHEPEGELNVMSLIFSKCPNLKELILSLNPVDKINCLLAGHPTQAAYLLFHPALRIEDPSGPLSNCPPPLPSLPDLKRLQKLRIDFDGPFSSVRLNEIGVFLAFLRLQPLTELCLGGMFMISEYLASKLTSHHLNVYFKPDIPGYLNRVDDDDDLDLDYDLHDLSGS